MHSFDLRSVCVLADIFNFFEKWLEGGEINLEW